MSKLYLLFLLKSVLSLKSVEKKYMFYVLINDSLSHSLLKTRPAIFYSVWSPHHSIINLSVCASVPLQHPIVSPQHNTHTNIPPIPTPPPTADVNHLSVWDLPSPSSVC